MPLLLPGQVSQSVRKTGALARAGRTGTDSVLMLQSCCKGMESVGNKDTWNWICSCLSKTEPANSSKPHLTLMPGVLYFTKMCLGWNGHLNKILSTVITCNPAESDGDHMTSLWGYDCISSSQRTELNTTSLLLLFQVHINKKGSVCMSWRKAKLKVNIFMYFINIHVFHK